MEDTKWEALRSFVEESNAIEGIQRPPLLREIEAHAALLRERKVRAVDLIVFVQQISGALLRAEPGQDVMVGRFRPPPGGPEIAVKLDTLLSSASVLSPWRTHVLFERLHPFIDGNGRAGRALWLWQTHHATGQITNFLREFYMQTLRTVPVDESLLHG